MKEAKFCKIINKGGKHMVETPKGEIIPGVIWTRVWDGLPDEPGYTIVKIITTIEDEHE